MSVELFSKDILSEDESFLNRLSESLESWNLSDELDISEILRSNLPDEPSSETRLKDISVKLEAIENEERTVSHEVQRSDNNEEVQFGDNNSSLRFFKGMKKILAWLRKPRQERIAVYWRINGIETHQPSDLASYYSGWYLTAEQQFTLDQFFMTNQSPSKVQVQSLAQQLCITEEEILIYFQSKRATSMVSIHSNIRLDDNNRLSPIVSQSAGIGKGSNPNFARPSMSDATVTQRKPSTASLVHERTNILGDATLGGSRQNGEERAILENYYHRVSKYPTKEEFQALASNLNMNEQTVRIFFKNKRSRTKKESNSVLSSGKSRFEGHKPSKVLQRQILERFYQFRSKYPSKTDIEHLALQLDMSEKTLRIFFKNRRSREAKKQTQGASTVPLMGLVDYAAGIINQPDSIITSGACEAFSVQQNSKLQRTEVISLDSDGDEADVVDVTADKIPPCAEKTVDNSDNAIKETSAEENPSVFENRKGTEDSVIHSITADFSQNLSDAHIVRTDSSNESVHIMDSNAAYMIGNLSVNASANATARDERLLDINPERLLSSSAALLSKKRNNNFKVKSYKVKPEQQTNSSPGSRSRNFTQHQKHVLAQYFLLRSNYPSKADISLLASQLDLPEKSVQIYFKNRRTRSKSKQNTLPAAGMQMASQNQMLPSMQNISNDLRLQDSQMDETSSGTAQRSKFFTREQKQGLDQYFLQRSHYPNKDDIKLLASQLNMSEKSVRIYFKNRRVRSARKWSETILSTGEVAKPGKARKVSTQSTASKRQLFRSASFGDRQTYDKFAGTSVDVQRNLNNLPASAQANTLRNRYADFAHTVLRGVKTEPVEDTGTNSSNSGVFAQGATSYSQVPTAANSILQIGAAEAETGSGKNLSNPLRSSHENVFNTEDITAAASSQSRFFSDEQRRRLDQYFSSKSQYPSREDMERLAFELRMSFHSVRIYFKNRRARLAKSKLKVTTPGDTQTVGVTPTFVASSVKLERVTSPDQDSHSNTNLTDTRNVMASVEYALEIIGDRKSTSTEHRDQSGRSIERDNVVVQHISHTV